MKFLDILALSAIFYFFHTLTHSFPSYFKEKSFTSPPQSYARLLQSTQSQDQASVINAFLNIFRLNTFCGSWEPTSRITQTDQYFSISSDKEKLVIINTTYSMSFNLILFESRYIDQGFMVLPINYTNLLGSLDYTTMTVDLKNQDILYGTGRNIITNFVENINSIDCLILNFLSYQLQGCQIQEAKMSFYNSDTKKPFAPLNDDVQDLRIDLQIKSQNCLFSFDAYSLMTCDQSSLQSWFYLLLNLIKVILSFNGTIVHFDRGLSEKTIQLQFTLLFALNCYIYFINVELVHSLAPAIFLIIPLSLFSIALDYTVLLKSFERCTALVITFVCVTICSILLFADNGVYWILVPFLAIPIIDFSKIFLPLNQYKHAFSVYLYYLLPSYCLLGFIKANPDNFARLTPNPDLVVICGIAFLVGLGIVRVGITIQHMKAEKRKARYFVELKEISRQDVCPICMNRLTRKKKKQKNQADLEAPLIESSDDSIVSEASDAQGEAEPVQDRIIKTPCDHKFHEKCLNQWLERKVECPYCRKPIPELA